MRCEEARAADMCSDMVEHGLGDCHTVIGRGAAAELVENDEGAGCCFSENLFGFGEFYKEGGLCGEDVVVCAEARHNAVAGG